MASLLVYGATGYTGGLVSNVLARRGLDFAIAGRSSHKLEELREELLRDHGVDVPAYVADVHSQESLDQMLEDARVMINCAGPFSDVGAPVVTAAVRNGVHYLDTTGEQAFMLRVRDELGAKAESANVVLAPACAFEYATGDCAAALAARTGRRRLALAYAAGTADVSLGTKKSIVRSLGSPGRTFKDGELVERKPGYRAFDVPLGEGGTASAIWFAGGEPLTVPRHSDVDDVENCILIDRRLAKVLPSLGGVMQTMAGALEPIFDAVIERFSSQPDRETEQERGFRVVAFDPEAAEPLVIVQGENPYAFTAEVIVEAAARLVDEAPKVTGFSSAAALFDPVDLLESAGAVVRIPASS